MTNKRSTFLCTVLSLLGAVVSFAQANGKLQIHHMDVGEGDGAVLISPGGQVVLFDVGEDLKRRDCTRPLAYLDQLGVKQIDLLFVSHYHFDHIGCIPAVLQQFPLQGDAYDRGESYPGTTFTNYKAAVGSHRRTAAIGDAVTLDKNSSNPVVITVVAVDGRSPHGQVQTSNENDLSLAVVVSFGPFREEIGGDLSGDNTLGLDALRRHREERAACAGDAQRRASSRSDTMVIRIAVIRASDFENFAIEGQWAFTQKQFRKNVFSLIRIRMHCKIHRCSMAFL